jgi:endogenous inhibitor of DNA gyrase (YacG/DUF329 family)
VTIRCPTCKKVLENVPDDFEHRPFCSARCKTIDLGNWLDEKYKVSRPIGPDEDDEEKERLLS